MAPGVDAVEFDGEAVALPGETVVIMLNKPAGYLTAMSDARGEDTVAKLVPVGDYPGLFPVGRLDRDTTGLMLAAKTDEAAAAAPWRSPSTRAASARCAACLPPSGTRCLRSTAPRSGRFRLAAFRAGNGACFPPRRSRCWTRSGERVLGKDTEQEVSPAPRFPDVRPRHRDALLYNGSSPF